MCIRTNQQPSTTQARLGQFCACATQSNKGKTRLNYSVKQQKLDHAPSARVQLQIGTTECSTQNNNILHVVMRLTESIHNKAGYNVTTDNFFISVHVASLLQQKKITIVGTVRNNSKGLTKEMTKCGNDMYGSKFYYNEQNECLFVNYQCKKKKNVNLLSTMHNAPSKTILKKRSPL